MVMPPETDGYRVLASMRAGKQTLVLRLPECVRQAMAG